jgi:septal ring-binding cell division protein DamX
MSTTPQLKDKVEFSLDNRQIFFLFFGLSVVGCFVFAMGVMVGKRGEVHELQAVAQHQQQEDSIVLLDDDPVVADNGYSFKDGLQRPATEGLPATRDPAVPPRDEETVREERDAALGSKSLKKAGSTKKLPAIPAAVGPKAGGSIPKGMPSLGGGDVPAAKAEPVAKVESTPTVALVEKPATDSVLAAVKGDAAVADAGPRAGKRFTLQMKAFSSEGDASKMADKLRRNGHEVRVESGEANGRMWHRVRMGEFSTWDSAVAAKQAFEKNEQVIAYVVTL